MASWGVNRLDVFVEQPARPCCIGRTTARNGTRLRISGAAILGGPGAVARGADRLDIFVRGADNQLWQKAWNGGWMGYFPLGGFLTSSPSASSWAPNRLDVFVRGSDNALYHKSWDGIEWSAYERLGGNLEGPRSHLTRAELDRRLLPWPRQPPLPEVVRRLDVAESWSTWVADSIPTSRCPRGAGSA